MSTHISPGNRPSLVVEVGTGTLYIDGEGIELPPQEFKVFLALAQRLDGASSAEELVESAWENPYGIGRQDVHWTIWKIRNRIGDKTRSDKIVAHRRGFGYFIDLPADNVQLIENRSELYNLLALEGVAPNDSLPDASEIQGAALADEVTRPDGGNAPDGEEQPISLTDLPAPSERPGRPRLPIALVAGMVGAGLAVTLWFTQRSAPSAPAVTPDQQQASAEPSPEQRAGERADDDRNRPKSKDKRKQGRDKSTDAPVLVAAGEPVSSDSGSQTGSTPQQPSSDKGENAPSLPAPPTQLLFHLFNPETGDHFVTTDGSVVSQYQGRGYDSRVIARVYTKVVSGTKPITLNAGAAYIFTDQSPKTEPQTSTVPLWLLKDGKGDFYYSRSGSQPDGWSASLVGYVRAP